MKFIFYTLLSITGLAILYFVVRTMLRLSEALGAAFAWDYVLGTLLFLILFGLLPGAIFFLRDKPATKTRRKQ